MFIAMLEHETFPHRDLGALRTGIMAGSPCPIETMRRVTTDMGAAAITASNGIHAQLQTLLPGKTSAQVWALQGATMMNGVDDYPKRTEITDLGDAQQLLDFARANGMSALSIWAIQRDNGSCAGGGAANDCSGIAQGTWDFSHLLSSFTG